MTDRAGFGDLAHAVRSLFFRKSDEPAQRAVAVEKGTAATGPTAHDEDQLEERAREWFISRGQTSAGRFQLVGLEAIKERLGDRWRRLKNRVHAVATTTLRRRLLPHDMFTQLGDHGYAVVFSDLSPPEAEAKCALISEEIARLLLGEGEAAGAIEVKTMVVEIDGPSIAKKTDIFAALEVIFEGGGTPPSPHGEPDAGTEPPGGLTEKEGVAAPCRPRTARPGTAPRRQARAPAHADPEPVSALKYRFRPIWDVRRNALLTYQCVTDSTPEVGAPVGFVSSAELNAQRDRVLRHDLLTLAELVRGAKSLLRHGRRILLSGCVHYESLAQSAARAGVLEICNEIPEAYRELMIFEIVALPANVPQMQLSEIVPTLVPLCRAVHCQVDLRRRRFDNMDYAGIDAVGIDISGSSESETDLIPEFNEFAAAAKGAGFSTFAHGIRSTSLAVGAVGAGIEYISGDSIHMPVEQLGSALRFGYEDLYLGKPALATSAPP